MAQSDGGLFSVDVVSSRQMALACLKLIKTEQIKLTLTEGFMGKNFLYSIVMPHFAP